MGTIGKAVEVPEAVDVVVAIEQAARKICEASYEASDAYSGNARDVARLLVKEGKTTKGACPKIMEGWLALPSIRVLDARPCNKFLEELVPPEYKEDLLQVSFANSAQ